MGTYYVKFHFMERKAVKKELCPQRFFALQAKIQTSECQG